MPSSFFAYATTIPIYIVRRILFPSIYSLNSGHTSYMFFAAGYVIVKEGDLAKNNDEYIKVNYGGDVKLTDGYYLSVGFDTILHKNFMIRINLSSVDFDEVISAPGYATEKYGLSFLELSLNLCYRFNF